MSARSALVSCAMRPLNWLSWAEEPGKGPLRVPMAQHRIAGTPWDLRSPREGAPRRDEVRCGLGLCAL